MPHARYKKKGLDITGNWRNRAFSMNAGRGRQACTISVLKWAMDEMLLLAGSASESKLAVLDLLVYGATLAS